MANKEAVVIVLDVGPTMGTAAPGHKSPLDLSIDCINMVIQRKIFLDPKDEVAMLLFGTENTENSLARQAEENGDLDQYQNISRMRGLTIADWDFIEELEGIKSSDIHADIMDALVVALDLLKNEGNGKKIASYKILLFSDLESNLDDDGLDSIVQGFGALNVPVELKVICPFSIDEANDADGESSDNNHGDSADDNEFRVFQKTKTERQIRASNILSQFLSDVGGISVSLSEIMPGMRFYLSGKSTRAAAWNVDLTIGSSLQIPVSSFKKVSAVQRKTWTKTLAEDDSVTLATDPTYHLNDEAQTEIERDDTITAYCYGSTLVPFTDEDKVNMAYQVDSKCLSVVGFTKQSNIKRYHFVGEKVDFVVARKDDDAAAVALSAVIHALFETDMVAIARYAYSARSSPRLVMLAPRIKDQFECLVSMQLPFMEDLRQFTFAPLDVTTRNIPSDNQLQLIDQLITDFDLSAADNSDHLFHPKNVSDLYSQRYYQCLGHRATNPSEPLPELPTYLSRLVETPQSVLSKAQELLNDINNAFRLETIEKKAEDKTGAAIFDVDKDLNNEPPPKKLKADDDLEGGLANIIGSVSQPLNDAPTEDDVDISEDQTKNTEPDEADDLLDMM